MIDPQMGIWPLEEELAIRIRDQLVGLEPGTAGAAQLARWLRGLDLPAVGHDEEPYVWLYRGLIVIPDPDLRDRVTQAAAQLLTELPLSEIGAYGELKQLLGLLDLCTLLAALDLRVPTKLAGPLRALLDPPRFASDAWGGQLSASLRRALAANQPDVVLQPVWEQMLAGRRHPLLGGGPSAGFEGLRRLASPSGGLSRPNFNAIGLGLKGMADYLEDDPTKAVAFPALIQRAISPWPGHPWDRELILQGDEHYLPLWAVRRLPSLLVSRGPRDGGMERFLIWRYILGCAMDLETRASPFQCTVCDAPLCVTPTHESGEGEVYEIEIDQAGARYIRTIAPILEHFRENTPGSAEGSACSTIIHGLSLLEAYLDNIRPWEFAIERKFAIERVAALRSRVTKRAKTLLPV